MPSPESIDILPYEWRRLFPPIGGVWTAAAGLTVLIGQPGRVNDLTAGRPLWLTVIAGALGAITIWLIAATAALVGAAGIEKLVLHRWPRLGRAVIKRRQRRWDRLTEHIHERVSVASRDGAIPYVQRRTAISPTRPVAATRLADRWAATEARVRGAYGLDLTSTWPRLWLVIPEYVRTELRSAALIWHSACMWWCWAVLFALLGFLWWPHVIVAVALGLYARSRLRPNLIARAELVESVYDIYGTDLADALSVPLGPARRLDPAKGAEITSLVRKGS